MVIEGLWHDDRIMTTFSSLCRWDGLAAALLLIALLPVGLVGEPETTPAAKLGEGHLLIRGNVITPDGMIEGGWLDVEKGRILHLGTEKPDLPGASVLETKDLIFPGFIDLHNHPSFNVFPRWTPPHKFANRYAWRDWAVYQEQLEGKARKLQSDPANFCDIDEYVEVKALIGGTTSIIGLGSNHMPGEGSDSPDCLKGLVRNLDHYTGFYGQVVDRERIANSIGILPRDMDAQTAALRRRQIEDGEIDLLCIHIAEGLPTDAESGQELDLLDAHGLLGPHTALIHSVGLSASQLARVHKAGSSIVWSPRSNFELYGATANVEAAFREGTTISLAPDWSPSGSDNMWEEIQYAQRVSEEHLNNLFTARQLVEMASSVPARVAAIGDKVGTLAPGMLADFFLVHEEDSASELKDPAGAVVRQGIASVDLVVIGGVPTYGDPTALKSLGLATEPLTVCGTEKALNSAALPHGPFAEVTARLRIKMKALGSELGPLDSCPNL
jgi:5-methylthioadenosine/S-adenosylhomocysteine deaminase